MPMGRGVSERMSWSPARNPCPWTNVSEMGWTMPIPPASLAAATSSGLLHGYIAPQTSGTPMPAWRAAGVSRLEPPAGTAEGGAVGHVPSEHENEQGGAEGQRRAETPKREHSLAGRRGRGHGAHTGSGSCRPQGKASPARAHTDPRRGRTA